MCFKFWNFIMNNNQSKYQTEAADRHTDIFAIVDEQYKCDFLNRMQNTIENDIEKCNIKSDRLLKHGQRLARKRQWIDAAELFNSSLCFSEIGSKYEKLAYKERLSCFIKRNKFDEAAIDFELVDQEPPFKKVIPRRSERNRNTIFEPKLSYDPNKLFPSMANVLEVLENKEYGKHVLAKHDINVGQMIVVCDQYATAICANHRQQAYCLTCFKTDTNFIPCEQCSKVMFCSQKCQTINNVHELECNTIFHIIRNTHVKLAIQMFLNAIKHFPNADQFIKFVYSNINEQTTVSLATDPTYRYGLLLRLKYQYNEADIWLCYQAYELLMTIPWIKIWFHSNEQQIFLKHLLLHHMAIIHTNGFVHHFGWNDRLEIEFIYDTISLFNHSCAPNAFFALKNNVGYLVTVRPIKKGDQIFINYLGDKSTELKSVRNQLLMSNWGFQCQCERCKPIFNQTIVRSNVQQLKNDDAFKYVVQHTNDYTLPFGNKRRIQLIEKCIALLSKYGHIWSFTLDFVIEVYILSSTNHVD